MARNLSYFIYFVYMFTVVSFRSMQKSQILLYSRLNVQILSMKKSPNVIKTTVTIVTKTTPSSQNDASKSKELTQIETEVTNKVTVDSTKKRGVTKAVKDSSEIPVKAVKVVTREPVNKKATEIKEKMLTPANIVTMELVIAAEDNSNVTIKAVRSVTRKPVAKKAIINKNITVKPAIKVKRSDNSAIIEVKSTKLSIGETTVNKAVKSAIKEAIKETIAKPEIKTVAVRKAVKRRRKTEANTVDKKV
jgi:hypothetical protein